MKAPTVLDEPTVLADLVQRSPEDIALADDTQSRSWRELDTTSHAIARSVEARGVTPGQHVALICTNRVEFAEAVIGLTRGGFTFTPVKTNWAAAEMEYLLLDAASAAVIADTDSGREIAHRLGLPLLDIGDGWSSVPRWTEAVAAGPIEAGRTGCRIPYTSGTTGKPKGVHRSAPVPTFEDWVAASAGYNGALGLPTTGTHLMVAQMFHGAPLNFGMGAMFGGCTLRIMSRWDAADGLRLLSASAGPLSSIMVPTMFRQLLALPEADRDSFDPSTLAAILHGGEACPVALKQQMIDWWGPVLTEYYGFTEGGMTLATSADWLERPGTVGQPLGPMTITIRDDDGELLPSGETGTVFFRRETGRFFSYANADDKTDAAHADDDSFTVGDIGRLDSDGYLYLSGRTAELIVAAGVNIYPAEIEDVLFTVPGVIDACVVAGPDPDRGEQPVAFVQLAPGTPAGDVVAAINQACTEQLAGYKRPRHIETIDAIPRDPTGKLLRTSLRDSLWP